MAVEDAPEFGPLLKRLRRAAGLSQEDLAERSGVSARAISDLERGINRTPRRDTERLLLDALNLEPEEQTRFLAAAHRPLDDAEPAESAPSPLARQLAALPRLIGREREVTAAGALLVAPRTRLLTLIGPGGVGKTRLALEVAAGCEPRFPDGAVVVSLATVTDADAVPAAIAARLAVRETGPAGPLDQLIAYLADRGLLLVLDNVEQIADAAPLIADLLSACPGVTGLVTSRAPLRLRIEREFPVAPLTLPSPEETSDLAALGRSPAVALFVERVGAVAPDFALTEANAAAVAAICRRLDGLPLAIELAAARARALPIETIRDRLDRSLDLLTTGPRDLPPRQQTLRAAIAWSYDLLSPTEQTLFHRLAVFAGGITLDAAEAVTEGDEGGFAGSPSILDSFATLVAHNLVQRQTDRIGPGRFTLLETIREFATERLDGSGEAARSRDRHADLFLSFAETAVTELGGAGQAAWLERLEVEHDNLRAALRWLTGRGDSARAVRLAGALWWFWWVRGHLSEGREWLDLALSLPGEVAAAARARALTGAGTIAETQGDLATAGSLFSEALDLARLAGDARGESRALVSLGAIAAVAGDHPRAVALWEEDLALCRESGNQVGVAYALFSLAKVASTRGEFARARHLYDESLALLQALGDTRGLGATLTDLGILSFLQGDPAAAIVSYDGALAVWRELGDKQGIGRTLACLAEAHHHAANIDEAAEHFAGALTLSRQIGDRWGVATVLVGQGQIALSRGDARSAARQFADALTIFVDLQDKVEAARCLESLASAAIELIQPHRAATWLATAAALRAEVGVPLPAAYRPDHDRSLAAARSVLGEADFAAAFAAGQSRSLATSVKEAADLADSTDATAAR